MHAFTIWNRIDRSCSRLPPPKLKLVPGMDSAAALPAQARPVSHSAALATDYPSCGGVPQCIMAAAKPRVVVPGRLWEVHAGLPMEAFWCAHGPADVTLYNFAMPSTTGARQPTRKGKPLATVLRYHARFRTAADTLQLTEAGEAQHNGTVVARRPRPPQGLRCCSRAPGQQHRLWRRSPR